MNYPQYIKFYYRSFFDLSFAVDLSIEDARNNSIDFLIYKFVHLQQSMEKLYKSILLYKDPDFDLTEHCNHDLRKLAKALSKKIGINFIKCMGNYYKDTLGDMYTKEFKINVRNDIKHKRTFPEYKEEEIMLFEQLCILLEEGYNFARYPDQLSETLLRNAEGLHNDYLLNCIISSHHYLLYEYFEEEDISKISNMILSNYPSRFNIFKFLTGFLSQFQKIYFPILKFEETKTHKEIILLLHNKIFISADSIRMPYFQ